MNRARALRELAYLEKELAKLEEGARSWDAAKIKNADSAEKVFSQASLMLNEWKRDGISGSKGSIEALVKYMDYIMSDAEQFKHELEEYISSAKLTTKDSRLAKPTKKSEPKEDTDNDYDEEPYDEEPYDEEEEEDKI